MKRFFVCFAIFAAFTAMILMISCGGNSSSGGSSVSNFGKLGGECYPNETCDEGFLCDTENNICVEDPENPVQDSDTSSEQTNDNVDTAYEQNDDKTDTLPENDNDSADDGDTIDPDTTDSGETDGETRVQDCTGLPENAEWNTVSSITQRWDGEKWVPSAVASFNFEGSENECRFKCVSGYTWDGSQCVQPSDPCNPNPCINMPNSTGDCTLSSTSYVCGCRSGYKWSDSSCIPDASSTLPECSRTSGTPCKNSSSGLIWSAASSYGTIGYSDAKSYCESYSEGGLSDWHLPTIDELITLLRNADRVTNNCQVSETNNCLSYSSCWSCSTCTQTGTQSSSGKTCDSWGSDDHYSTFGDEGWFWSSSVRSDNPFSSSTTTFDFVWGVNFSKGFVFTTESLNGSGHGYVRCVR